MPHTSEVFGLRNVLSKLSQHDRNVAAKTTASSQSRKSRREISSRRDDGGDTTQQSKKEALCRRRAAPNRMTSLPPRAVTIGMLRPASAAVQRSDRLCTACETLDHEDSTRPTGQEETVPSTASSGGGVRPVGRGQFVLPYTDGVHRRYNSVTFLARVVLVLRPQHHKSQTTCADTSTSDSSDSDTFHGDDRCAAEQRNTAGWMVLEDVAEEDAVSGISVGADQRRGKTMRNRPKRSASSVLLLTDGTGMALCRVHHPDASSFSHDEDSSNTFGAYALPVVLQVNAGDLVAVTGRVCFDAGGSASRYAAEIAEQMIAEHPSSVCITSARHAYVCIDITKRHAILSSVSTALRQTPSYLAPGIFFSTAKCRVVHDLDEHTMHFLTVVFVTLRLRAALEKMIASAAEAKRLRDSHESSTAYAVLALSQGEVHIEASHDCVASSIASPTSPLARLSSKAPLVLPQRRPSTSPEKEKVEDLAAVLLDGAAWIDHRDVVAERTQRKAPRFEQQRRSGGDLVVVAGPAIHYRETTCVSHAPRSEERWGAGQQQECVSLKRLPQGECWRSHIDHTSVGVSWLDVGGTLLAHRNDRSQNTSRAQPPLQQPHLPPHTSPLHPSEHAPHSDVCREFLQNRTAVSRVASLTTSTFEGVSTQGDWRSVPRHELVPPHLSWCPPPQNSRQQPQFRLEVSASPFAGSIQLPIQLPSHHTRRSALLSSGIQHYLPSKHTPPTEPIVCPQYNLGQELTVSDTPLDFW